MANKIQLRRDTTSNWNRINPILADGEPGLNITTNQLKYGDGTTAWNDLPYQGTDPTRLVSGESVVALTSGGKVSMPGLEIDGTGDFSAIYSNYDTPGTSKAILVSPSDGDTGLMLPQNSTAATEPARLYNVNATGTVKITTNTGAGENNWIFDSNGSLIVPTVESAILSLVGTDATPLNISGIAVDVGNSNTVTVTTSLEHGITQNGTKVKISGLTRCTQLDQGLFYVVPSTINNLLLFTDVDYNVPFDGSLLTEPYATTGPRATTEAAVPHNPQSTSNQTPFVGEQSIYFDGSSYIRAEASSAFDFNVGPFSVSFWVYPTSYSNGRIFTFGTWPTETLGMSNEGSATPYVWLNGQLLGVGTSMSLNAWHYIVITRFQNTMSFSMDGVTYNSFPGIGYDLYMAATKTLTIGNDASGQAGFTGYIRDFKINVGAGIDPSTITVPTGPASVDASTKILLLANKNDQSGSGTVTGGGTVTEKIPSGTINIVTAPGPNDSDHGDINLNAGFATLKVDGKRNVVALSTPARDYPINGSGQDTIVINATSATTPIDATTTISWLNNVWYVRPETGYGSTGTSHTIIVPIPERVGVEVTIINDTDADLVIVDWDGPITGMVAFASIKLMSYKDETGQIWWWQTSAFSW